MNDCQKWDERKAKEECTPCTITLTWNSKKGISNLMTTVWWMPRAGGGTMTAWGHEGIFWGEGHILYINCDCSYVGICICQTLPSSIHKMTTFYFHNCTSIRLILKTKQMLPLHKSLSPILLGLCSKVC